MKTAAAGLKGERTTRFLMRVERVLVSVGSLTILVMCGHILVNVIARKAGAPLPDVVELSAYWYLPIIAFVGIVASELRDGQIEASLLFDAFGPTTKRIVHHAISLLAGICGVALGLAGLFEAAHAFEIGKVALASDVIVWPVMFFTALCLVAYGCVALMLTFRRSPRSQVDMPIEEQGGMPND